MTEKLTPEEIKKALECCVKNDCTGCPYREFNGGCCCVTKLMEDVFELHKSQQAEIERLQTENNQFADIGKMYSEIRAEAIKEFWNKLQGIAYQSSDWSHGEHPMVVELDDVEEIYDEMVGD